MNKMAGFTAEASLRGKGGHYHAAMADHQTSDYIHAAGVDQNCFNACYTNCNQDCFGLTGSARGRCLRECKKIEHDCIAQCTQDNGGGGGGGGSSECTPLFPSGSGLPIYGNYCGPGHTDPTGLTPPVDAVDAVCRAHDLCYDATNTFNCGCDRALITSMPAAIDASPCFSGKSAGFAAMVYFANAPCVCNIRVCSPLGGCTTVPVPGRGGIGVC